MKRYKTGKVKSKIPGLNVLLVLTFLFGIIIIIGMTGCASTEKDILADLEADPNNPEVIEDAAEFYYKEKEYNEAYRLYKRLEELKPIDDLQKYQMYVSGTRDTGVNKESWEKIYPVRNSETIKYIKYTKLNFDDIAKLSLPEHWIVIEKKFDWDESIIDKSGLPDDYKDLLGSQNSIKETTKPKKKKKGRKKEGKPLKKRTTLATKTGKTEEKNVITRGDYIYGGPGFIMRFDGISGFSVPTETKSIQRTVYYSRSAGVYDSQSIKTKITGESKIDDLLKRLLNFKSLSDLEIRDPEFYMYKVLSRTSVGSKTKYEYEKIKYDMRSYANCFSKKNRKDYISWIEDQITKTDPYMGYILWTHESGQDDRFVSITFFKLKLYYGYGTKITACFKEENKEIYLKELEKFFLD